MRTTRLSIVTAHGALSPAGGSALVNYTPSLFVVTPCFTPRQWVARTPRTRSVGVRLKSSLFGLHPNVQEDVSVLQLPVVEPPDVAVIWFTSSDLRVHDHDGLVASAAAAAMLPVYVFDDQELAAESPLDAAFTYHAVQELRNTLRSLGSDLVVRSGDVGKEVVRLVEQVGASRVFFHKSPVHSLRQSHERVKASLASLELLGGVDALPVVQLSSWSAAQLTGVEESDPSGAWNFRDFERSAAGGWPARSAFPAPASLPPLPSDVVAGDLPSLDDVITRVGSTDKRVKKALSDASLEEAPFGTSKLCVEGYGESWALRTLNDYLSMDEEDFARSLFGPEDVSKELAETGLEAAATRRIVRARGYRGLAPGEALARAMGYALALGCISPRRMFRARRTAGDGVLGAVRRLASGKCWARELAMRESWHFLLALRDVTVANDFKGGAMEQRYLRWHGWLVRYAVGGSRNPTDPAALLVHGFGASSDQWDRVFEQFATEPTDPSPQRGLRLTALDLIGFGHSAKPPLTYSQYSWADCARDVALRVGGGPFFVAGNSIGGYISMGLAAECRELCQGVVLVNSAGRILTAEDFEIEVTRTYGGLNVESATRLGKLGAYSAPPNAALAVLGTGLFAFLQGRIAKILRNLYPVNADLVDQGLAENILRDSCDPGAIGVIAAGGKLPFSRSANEMLNKFGRPVLVTQGVKDPLNDAEGRATSFEALGPQVEVVRLDGGHCPHHEVAEEVSRAMYGFIERVQVEEQRVFTQAA